MKPRLFLTVLSGTVDVSLSLLAVVFNPWDGHTFPEPTRTLPWSGYTGAEMGGNLPRDLRSTQGKTWSPPARMEYFHIQTINIIILLFNVGTS